MADSTPPTEQPRMLRPKDGRVLLGVCAGLARAFGTDAVVVRAAACVPLAIGLAGAAFLHFGASAQTPHALVHVCGWLAWLSVAAIAAYVLAAAVIPQE